MVLWKFNTWSKKWLEHSGGHLELPLNNFGFSTQPSAFFELFRPIIFIVIKESFSQGIAGLSSIRVPFKLGVLRRSVLYIKLYGFVPFDKKAAFLIHKLCMLPFLNQFSYENIHWILFPLITKNMNINCSVQQIFVRCLTLAKLYSYHYLLLSEFIARLVM